MRLGSETGSVINHLHSRAVIGQPEPAVGMGGTVLLWTDRHAVTIFRVFKVGKLTYIETRQDHHKRISGSVLDGSADYEHKINVNGSVEHFRREAAGQWTAVRLNAETGRWGKCGSHGFRIGERDTYRDPSF